MPISLILRDGTGIDELRVMVFPFLGAYAISKAMDRLMDIGLGMVLVVDTVERGSTVGEVNGQADERFAT